ncbi:hypothetical protein [Nonomuraea sp. NPDC046570]|uniref:hypothetical protein n=1 Tax=Nonomuraea sp. NPDC046570 TaxID=3155255 RepID=UPI0033EF9206
MTKPPTPTDPQYLRHEPPTPMEPQRLRHGPGERLALGDFADQARLDDQVRWWHNRALHHAYGVAAGLAVTVAAGFAAVEPGLAYDCHGRELPLREGRRVAVPEGEETFYLVLAWGGCGEVKLSWVPRSAFSARHGVALATGDAGGGFRPPRVRPLARPLIGHGATVTGQTSWQPWMEQLDEEWRELGVQVAIDTSAAGFTAVPCYFAQISGPLWTSAAPLLPLTPFGHVAEATKDGFSYRLLMPWAASQDRAQDGAGVLTRAAGLAVTWIGVQEYGSFSLRHDRRPA